MEYEKIVMQCAAKVYGVEIENISVETDIREELSNQSIKLLTFLSAVEGECGVVFDLAQTGELKTIKDIVDKVQNLK